MLTFVRYVTIMLGALALALGVHQALVEVRSPALMSLSTMLVLSAAVGAVVQVLLLRGRAGFGLAFGGALILSTCCVIWSLVTFQAPDVGRLGGAAWQFLAIRSATLRTAELRDIYGMVGAAWMLGFSLLVISAIRPLPHLRTRTPRAVRGPLPLIRSLRT